MKHTSFSKILFALVLTFFIAACATGGGSGGWKAGSASTTPPENLLLEKEVVSQAGSSQVWFDEDGSLVTQQDIASAAKAAPDVERQVLPSVEVGQYDNDALMQRSEVKNYVRDDRVVQGRVLPLSALSNVPKVKVAILLPLSGEHKKVGQAILNAAQLAMFDVAGKYFELMPRDTQGTPEGARNAAESAIENGAELILGPLFADDVNAVKSVARGSNINVITFSTDWKLADSKTFVMGFHPFDQVRRVMSYAASKGLTRQAVLAPQNAYGDAVTNAFSSIANSVGASNVGIKRYRTGDEYLGELITEFTGYNKDANLRKELPFNAVLLPMGGAEVRSVSSLLKYYGADTSKARFLGTGLWDDPSILREISMLGGWYAAPPPSSWDAFSNQYRSVYGAEPVRIASLGYDATALVAVLARQGIGRTGRPDFDYQSLTNPSGFAGIDGIFRFSRNGLAERGLAVMEITQSGPVVVSPAPTTFQAINN